MVRFDLTDFEWSMIGPLRPTKVRGVKRVDDRRVLNGIFWRLRAGAPWADILALRSGHDLREPLQPLASRGTGRILEALSAAYEGDVQMIDSSLIRVHQHGANGGKKGDPVAWAVRAAA